MKIYTVFTLFFTFLLISFLAISQVDDNETLAKAIQLYNSGKYSEAELLLKNILKDDPKDITVNYYYGACRTENNHFSNSDLESLIIANQDNTPIKINYYFGIQYHTRSNWERALKFYNKYNSTATISEEERQDLLGKIQQCYDKINPYEEYILDENQEVVNRLVEVGAAYESDLLVEDDVISEITDDVLPMTAATISGDNLTSQENKIEFQVNSEITYIYLSHFRTEEGKSLFEQGDSKQQELNRALIQAEELRDKYNDATSNEEKNLLGQDILALETETYSLKKEATQFLVQAKNIEYEYWQNADIKEINEFKQELNRIMEINENEHVSDVVVTDSVDYINPDILLGNGQFVAPAEENKETDLVYKIQIGAYSRGLPTYVKKLFDKLSLIRKIESYTDEKGIVVYTTGNLTKLEDALIMQNQVRQEGVEDAFVVPYFKGKRISLKDAKELEGKQ